MTYNFNNVEDAYGFNNVPLSKIYGSGNYLLWEKKGGSVDEYKSIPFTIEIVDDYDYASIATPFFSFYTTSSNVSYQIEYNFNNNGWNSITIGYYSGLRIDNIKKGDTLQMRGNNSSYFESSIHCTRLCKIYGNIMSLISKNNFSTLTTLTSERVFAGGTGFVYFLGGSSCIDASNLVLPATTLTKQCYMNLFYGAPLVYPPKELPATSLKEGCYEGMFNATKIIEAPYINAQYTAKACCRTMFDSCYYLVKCQDTLFPTTLITECYRDMFGLCRRLENAPALPATTLATYCYFEMFRGCTTLTTAPDLLATTLVQNCYSGMFNGASNLNFVRCYATNSTQSQHFVNEFLRSTASSGTFIKKSGATWATSSSSNNYSGIPSSWTVISE